MYAHVEDGSVTYMGELPRNWRHVSGLDKSEGNDEFLKTLGWVPLNETNVTPTRDQKFGLEFEKKEYDIIDSYCKEKEIEWFVSSWDTDSQLFTRNYDLKYNKIASAMLTNLELLKMVLSVLEVFR